jgi:hypothetical protein
MQVPELSHTAPYHRPRSHSIPSHSTSSGSPSGRSASASPAKPVLDDLAPASPGRPISYPHHSRDTYTPSIRISNPDGDALRSRLHDLLRDSPTSSSLPNMSSTYFSSSLNRVERDASAVNTVSPPPTSRTGGLTTGKPHNAGDGFSHLLASGPQSSSRPASSPSPFVGQRYSSASTEAKKQEEERRRKHLEEKQQRREERYKAERQREGQERQKEERYGADNERQNQNADREHPAKPPSSTATRWDQHLSSSYIYAAPNSVSPSKRGAGNAHNQPSGVAPHAFSGGHKSRPVPIPTTSSAHNYS